MIEEAIYSILTGDSRVASIVGTRVYPVIVPQPATLPVLVYSRISTVDDPLTHSGPANVVKAVYQILCLHPTITGAKTLASAVRAAMHGYSGIAGSEKVFYAQCVNQVDAYEHDTGVYSAPIDILIMHRST